MDQKHWGTMKKSTKILLIVVVFIALYQTYAMFAYMKAHPGNTYEYNSYMATPQELQMKLDYTNQLRLTLFAGCCVAFFWMFCQYKEAPEGHLFGLIANVIKNNKGDLK